MQTYRDHEDPTPVEELQEMFEYADRNSSHSVPVLKPNLALILKLRILEGINVDILTRESSSHLPTHFSCGDSKCIGLRMAASGLLIVEVITSLPSLMQVKGY